MPIIDLMSEIPYASALTADYIPDRCLFCFLPRTPQSRTCNVCGVVIYCSIECQKTDAYEHEPECKAYRNWKVAQRGQIEDANAAYGDEKLRLLARLIRRHHRDGGIQDLTTNRPKSVKERKLNDLMSHRDDLLRDAVRSLHLQDYAADLYGYFANTTEEFSPFYTTVDEIEEYVGKMVTNCFGIPVTTADDETHIGVAVYLTSSRFDHTCKPNLFMDFEGNRLTCRYYYEIDDQKSPDYDQLSVSYGYAPSFAGFTALATRQQRLISLNTRYYFVCKCDWCIDDRDADLSECATSRLCKTCGEPYIFQPDTITGFTMKQTCQCSNLDWAYKDCFEQPEVAKDLDKLVKEWCTTFHPTEKIESAIETVTKLEPLRRLAHKYWHPVINLRYVQLNETLFHANRSIALSGCPDSSTSPTIYPIPEAYKVSKDTRARALIAGRLAGEMVMDAYEHRLDPHETVVARFCYQLAELYELGQHMDGALKKFQKALRIWEYHGQRGETQANTVKAKIEHALAKGAKITGVDVANAGMKNLNIAKKEEKEEAGSADSKNAVNQGGKKKRKKKKK